MNYPFKCMSDAKPVLVKMKETIYLSTIISSSTGSKPSGELQIPSPPDPAGQTVFNFGKQTRQPGPPGRPPSPGPSPGHGPRHAQRTHAAGDRQQHPGEPRHPAHAGQQSRRRGERDVVPSLSVFINNFKHSALITDQKCQVP